MAQKFKQINMKHLIFIILLLSSLPLAAQSTQKAHNIDKVFSENIVVSHNYLLHVPKDKRHAVNGKLPLIVFLHGAGERGDNIELLKVHGPPKKIDKGEDLPFIVLSPQCKENTRWNPQTIKILIDQIITNYPVDDKRIYLTGLSMGGYGTWDLAIKYPHKFAAIAPICGGSDVHAWDASMHLTDMPIWAFHGAMDEVVPVERTTRILQALKKAGSDAKLTIYPDANHDSWTATYDNPELYRWFLKHSN